MNLSEANKLTLEEALNYACSKIVEQGGQCLRGNDGCSYGNKEGKHCAVGWLLDEDNEELMDFRGGAHSLSSFYHSFIPKVIREDTKTFTILQNFHDELYQGPRDYELQRLKDHTGLELNEPHWQQWVDMGDEGWGNYEVIA